MSWPPLSIVEFMVIRLVYYHRFFPSNMWIGYAAYKFTRDLDALGGVVAL